MTIQHIKNILTQDRSLLVCYWQILAGDNEIKTNNDCQQRLLNQGIVFQWQMKLQIYPLYALKFNLQWAETRLLPSLFEKEIRQWVGDNQNLTTIIRDLALQKIEPFESEEDKQQEWITDLVQTNLINNWEIGQETQHRYLQNVSLNLTQSRKKLILYRRILNGIATNNDDLNNGTVNSLLNLGIIYVDANNHNIDTYRLYQTIFHDQWVKTKLIWRRIVHEIKEWIKPNERLTLMIQELAEQYTLPLNTGEEKQWVERLINEQVISTWNQGYEEIHQHLRDREFEVLEKKSKVPKLLELYKLWQVNNNVKLYETILTQANIEKPNKRAEKVLITSGIIRRVDKENLEVSNKLYKYVFDINWINNTKSYLDQKIKRYFPYLYIPITIPIKILLIRTLLIALIFIIIANAVTNIPFLPSPIQPSTNPLVDLKYATAAVSKLETKTRKKIGNRLPKFSDYKTVEPLRNLHTKISNIYQLNQIPSVNGAVTAVAFDPLTQRKQLDSGIGGRFMAGDDQGKLILYDYKGKILKEFPPFEKAITSIKYSQNGELIAVASQETEKRITLYQNNDNPESIELLDSKSSSPDSLDSFKSVDFSSSGKYLVTGGENGNATLWEIKKQVDSANLELFKITDNIKHGNSIETVKFSPDGNNFITVGEMGENPDTPEQIKLWSLKEILCHSRNIEECVFSSEDNQPIDLKPQIISSSNLQNIKSASVYEDATYQQLLAVVVGKDLNSHDSAFCLINITLDKVLACEKENGINLASFIANDNQNVVLTTSEYGKLNFWNYSPNIEEKDEIKINSTESSNQKILSIDISSDGQYLITSGEDKTIRIWKFSNFWNPHESIDFFKDGNQEITDIQIGIIGRTYQGRQDKRIRLIISMKDQNNSQKMEIWDVYDPENEFPRLHPDLQNYNKLIVVGDENQSYIVVFNQNGIGKFYNLSNEEEETKGEISPNPKSQQNPKPKLIKTNGNYIILSYENGYVSVWDINRKKKLLDYGVPIFNDQITNVDISPDGRYLAAIGDDDKPKIYKINFDDNDLSPIEWDRNPSPASIIKINPDNSNLVIGGKSGDVSLWSLEGKQLDIKKSSDQNHLEKIINLQFSSNGKSFVTLDEDNEAILWQITLKNKQTEIRNEREEKDVTAISISPQYLDGTVIAIAKQEEKVIKLWDIRGRDLAIYKTEMDNIEHLQFSPVRNNNDSKSYDNYIFAVDERGRVKAWEINNAQKLIEKTCNWLHEAYFSNDSDYEECKAIIQEAKIKRENQSMRRFAFK